MAESISDDMTAGGRGEVFNRYVRNESVTVAATTTTLVTAVKADAYRDFTLETYNGHATSTVTVKVWVSNRTTPGALAGADWVQLGTNISLSPTTGSVDVWNTARPLWIGVTATADVQTTTDNDCLLRMSS